MRTSGTPHLVNSVGKTTALERIRLGGTEIREGLLQTLLDENPSILPITKFEGNFGPLVSLGREIMGIDNLFITPSGRLTVVETKLWRNPQATRTVLAQILDYATRLSRLTFEEFEAACQTANQSALSSGTSLHQLVADQFPDLSSPEAEFTDNVQRYLRNGRFLLLVVGDGIREGLKQVLDALHQQSRLHFTFGLVELALYREPEAGGILVLPSVVAHSTEVERAVVTIRGGSAEQVEVAVRSGPAEQTPKLTEQEFLDSIQDPQARRFSELLFHWAREHARIEIAKSGKSAVIRVPFSATRTGLILLRVYRTGRVLVTPPRLRALLDKWGFGEQVLHTASALQRLFPEIEINPAKNQVCPPMQAASLLPKIHEVLEIYTRAIERLQAIDPGLESSSEADEDEDEDGDET